MNLQSILMSAIDTTNKITNSVALSTETVSITWEAVDAHNAAIVKKQQQDALKALLAKKQIAA